MTHTEYDGNPFREVGFPFPLPGLLKRTGIKLSWRYEVAKGAELLYEFHTDEDGHVTVTCHCARCEAEREALLPKAVDLSQLSNEAFEDYRQLDARLADKLAEADGRDQDGS